MLQFIIHQFCLAKLQKTAYKNLGKARKSVVEGTGLNPGKEFFYLLEKVISLLILLIVLGVTLRNEAISGHHGFDGSLRRLARQDARIVGYELAFEREPSEVIASVADATGYEFEATALYEAEPTCRIALALQLFTLAVFHHLALLLAEVK